MILTRSIDDKMINLQNSGIFFGAREFNGSITINIKGSRIEPVMYSTNDYNQINLYYLGFLPPFAVCVFALLCVCQRSGQLH